MSLSRAFPNQLEFVPYAPPSKKMIPPNEVVQSCTDKAPDTRPEPKTGQEDRANTASTPPSVEVIDLTGLANEDNHGMSDDENGASSNVGSDIDFSPSNEVQTAGSEEFIARRSTPQGNVCDESSSQPAPSEGSSQKNAVVLKDCQRESDTDSSDKDCPLENDIVTQTRGGLEDPSTSTSDRCGGEHSPAMENAIHSKLDEEHSSRASGRPLPGSTAAKSNGAIQEGGGGSLLKADSHRPQQPICKKADRQDSRITSSNDGSDGDVNDKNSTHTRKRKALPYLRPHSNRPSNVNSFSARRQSGYDYIDKYNDDSNDRGVLVPNCKRRKSGSRSRTDKYIEYEVKQIIDVRIDDKTDLQYRVLWVGYKDDPTWYNASNFKNSPHKLDDFHKANPTRPGPPKRLSVWLRCWEDTADHSDDNKPQ